MTVFDFGGKISIVELEFSINTMKTRVHAVSY